MYHHLKVISKTNYLEKTCLLLASWKSLRAESGAESVNKYGSEDPDPYQNFTVPEQGALFTGVQFLHAKCESNREKIRVSIFKEARRNFKSTFRDITYAKTIGAYTEGTGTELIFKAFKKLFIS
jgi:hypothetical protein